MSRRTLTLVGTLLVGLLAVPVTFVLGMRGS
jgi:hypothetical protein